MIGEDVETAIHIDGRINHPAASTSAIVPLAGSRLFER